MISGVVFETTPDGRRPIEGVSVFWDLWDIPDGGAGAETLSDAAGRFLLCGLPEGQVDNLIAGKEGFRYTNASVGSATATLDIELARR